MDCPDENTLIELLAGTLPEATRVELEAHLHGCQACSDLVAWLAADNLQQLAATVPSPSAPPTASGYVESMQPPSRRRWTLQPGDRVGNYRVIEPLGRGGMGEVYLAFDGRLHRRVALKIGSEVRPEQVERFLFEARATARFSHPHIITIHDVGDHQGHPYLALEYVDGVNLGTAIRTRAIEMAEVHRIGMAIAEAVREAHSHQILHRDLKPANVLLGADGRVRVLDFGLAQVSRDALEQVGDSREVAPLAADLPRVADRTGIYGTPAYLAPEQWGGRSERASDIWGLGLILAELITGQHPYRPSNLGELRMAVQSSEPVPLDLSACDSAPLADLVRRCLAKDPASRPRAVEVCAALRAIGSPENNTPSSTGGTGTDTGPRPAGSRQLRRLLLAAGGLALISGGALAVAWLRPPSNRRATLTPPVPKAVRAGEAHPRPQPGPVSASLPPVSPPASGPVHRPTEAVNAPPWQVPAARRTAPPRQGRLHVYTYGADGAERWAQLFVDGRYRGDTPITLAVLAAGRHRVEVRRAGFAPAVRSLRISPGGRSSVSFEMRRR